jgi:hypothetical protein
MPQVQESIAMMEDGAMEMQPVMDTITTALTTRRPRARYMVSLKGEASVLLRRLLPDRIWDWLLMLAFRT